MIIIYTNPMSSSSFRNQSCRSRLFLFLCVLLKILFIIIIIFIFRTKSGVEIFIDFFVFSYTCMVIRTTSYSPSKYEFYFVTGMHTCICIFSEHIKILVKWYCLFYVRRERFSVCLRNQNCVHLSPSKYAFIFLYNDLPIS